MRNSPLAWLVPAGILFLTSLAPGQDRVVSSLMCGADQGFNVAGIYYGTMPTSNPASRRADFIKTIKDKEIHALRFPGGTLANVYLPDNNQAMGRVPILKFASLPEPDKRDYVSAWQYFDFCTEAGIEPIYQLNTLLYAEREKVYLLADAGKGGLFGKDDLWGGSGVVLAPNKRAEAAKAVAAFVATTRKRGFKVTHWELGNEEYGGPRIDPKDYADIAVRFTHAVRHADACAQVWITLCDNAIRDHDSVFTIWAETLLTELSKTDIPADRNVGFTLHYVWPSIVDLAAAMVKKHGFRPRFAVTEYHMAGAGDYSDLSPRFGYALSFARYVIGMVPDRRIEILAVHDLVSQNFGILHYNAISYGPPDMSTWDPRRGYESTPTGDACGLFGKLIGGTIVFQATTADRLVVTNGDERRIFAVNDNRNPRPIHWPRDVVGERATRYEAVTLTPQAGPGDDPLRVDKVVQTKTDGTIAKDGLHWTLPRHGISYLRCFY